MNFLKLTTEVLEGKLRLKTTAPELNLNFPIKPAKVAELQKSNP
jgi:hypothetical protein